MAGSIAVLEPNSLRAALPKAFPPSTEIFHFIAGSEGIHSIDSLARAYFEMYFHLEDAISRYRDFEIRSPYIFYGVIIFVICYWWKYTKLNNPSGLPVIGRRWYEIGNGKARERFRDDCLGLVRSCFEKVSRLPGLVYCPHFFFFFFLAYSRVVRRCVLSLYRF